MTIKKKVKSNNKSIIKVKKNKKIRKSSNKKNKKFLSKKKKIIRQYGGLRVPKAPYWMPFFGRQNTGTISSSDRGIVSFINPMGGVKPEQPSIQNHIPVNNPQHGVYMELGYNNPTYLTISPTNEDAVKWATNPSYIVSSLSSSSSPPLPERMSSSIKLNTFDQEIDNLITNIAMRVLSTKSDKSDKSVRFKNNSNSEKYKAKIAELEKKVADLTKPLEEARQKAEAAAATASADPADPAATAKAASTNTEFEQYRTLMTELVANLLSKGATMPTVNISPVIQPHFYGNKMIYENSHRDSSEISTLIRELRAVIANPSAPPPPGLVSATETTIQQLQNEVAELIAKLGSGVGTSEQDAATEAEIAKHKQQITDLTDAMEELKGRVETAEKDIIALQNGLKEANVNITRLDGEQQKLSQSQVTLNQTFETFQTTFNAFETKFNNMPAQAAQTTREQQQQFEALLQQVNTAKDAAEAAAAQAADQVAAAQAARDDTSSEIARLEALIKANREASEARNADLEGRKLNREEFEAFQLQYKQTIAELQAKDAALEEAIAAATARNIEFSAQLATNTARIAEIERVRTGAVPGNVMGRVSQVQEGPLPSLLGLTQSELSNGIPEAKKNDLITFLINQNVIYQSDRGLQKTTNGYINFKQLLKTTTLKEGNTSYLKSIESNDTVLQTALNNLIARLNPT